MEIQLLPFAQARDILGFSSRIVPCGPQETPQELVARLAPEVPLHLWRVALDGEYATWETPVGAARELAIIPPVSGG